MTADPHSNAVHLLQTGRPGEAAVLLERRCEEQPNDGQAWFLLGASRHAMHELERALAAFERSLALDPENLQAAQAAIAVLCEGGKPDIALGRCEALLSRRPEDAHLHFSTALVHEAIGDLSEALQHYDRTLSLDSRFLGALQNRGFVLTRLGRFDDAIDSNRLFVAACPQSVDAHYNLAESCLAARRFDEAILAAENALKIDPGHALSQLDRGLALAASGRIEDARGDLRAVLARDDPSVRQRVEQWAAETGVVDPVDAGVVLEPEDIYLTMGCERLERCDWAGLDAFVERCAAMIARPAPGCLRLRALAFKLLHLPLRASLQKTVADRIALAAVDRASASPRPARTSRTRASRLRIGYLSADFGHHPVGFLTRSMYRLHDRGRFEVFGYALAADDGSENFRTISNTCDKMMDARALSLEQLASRIASDSIDVLVDLNGYTRNGRSHVLALRPAPIQVNYLGYPATLGGKLADYFIADATALPASLEPLFAEKIARLPHSYLPASHRSLPASAAPTRSEEGLPENGFVFCAFHRHEKIDPVAFASWMRILRAVPGSVLWLQHGPGEANLRRHARDAGIEPARLVFAPHREHSQHLARQRLADLFLDARCWNAHTTGSDALWAGVPMITCSGEHPVSRLGASLLHGIGLDELAAASFGEYEALAIDLATRPETLRALKAKLAGNRGSYPLFDAPRLVRNLERAYLEMWRIHESGAPPGSFDVEDPEPFAAPADFR